MAVSGLETRAARLPSEGLWEPWGPLGIPTFAAEEMGSVPLRRTRSWAGFKVHCSVEALRASVAGLQEECREDRKDDVSSQSTEDEQSDRGLHQGCRGAAKGGSSSGPCGGGKHGGVSGPGVTTLMVHNLPFALKVKHLVLELQSAGFGGEFDFVYLPFNVRSRRNAGYAFINFTSAEDACRFQHEWHNVACPFQHAKPGAAIKLRVRPAKVQGMDACVQMTSGTQSERMRSLYCKPWTQPADVSSVSF